jgi:hypothetical protein
MNRDLLTRDAPDWLIGLALALAAVNAIVWVVALS